MGATGKSSTGLPGFDAAIDGLRLGDNVVWQVMSVEDYRCVVEPFAKQALAEGRSLRYLRFGRHPPLLDETYAEVTCALASAGFESFATEVHRVLEEGGRRTFYVFDCLTDLVDLWHSDLLIGNFFRLTCPFLFQLEAVAYFAVIRNAHTYDTIAGIRETTQVLLDLYVSNENTYIHPLKVCDRYSPTMFFPHLIQGDEAVCITASAHAARLFAIPNTCRPPQDFWERIQIQAQVALAEGAEMQQTMAALLMSLVFWREQRVQDLCLRYFSLRDVLEIVSREVGSGPIGGKSVGMLLARKILEREMPERIKEHWEPHDSYYIGADVFYTYIVRNGWWDLRMRQKTPEGYFLLAPELRQNLLNGEFPHSIREQFMRLLEYFGQAPIIVRSSSLQEDSYGNAFAGKYDSVFCANQGSPEERYQAFERAVRVVYASSMGEDALAYRLNRGLADRDEQMAVLVQRVSGDHYGNLFFPHLAGVGNSSNLYIWQQDMDQEAGMLRLVLGLGLRAVNRTTGDYARLAALDAPTRPMPVAPEKIRQFSQHKADVLDLWKGDIAEISVDDLAALDIRAEKSLFFSPDEAAQRRSGLAASDVPDLHGFLAKSGFPELAREMLSTLAKVYNCPVDVEFTVNFMPDGNYVFNLLQCRTLQSRGLGRVGAMPEAAEERIFFKTSGCFMGGNARMRFDYIILVRVREYLDLPQRDQYATARLVGELNQLLKHHSVLLVGPGRWGTSVPSFGLPVNFTEICHMAALCEYSFPEEAVSPELSFGTHFFQDIVESGVFYAAIFSENPEVIFRPGLVLEQDNLLKELTGAKPELERVVHVSALPGLSLYADVPSQRLLCCLAPDR